MTNSIPQTYTDKLEMKLQRQQEWILNSLVITIYKPKYFFNLGRWYMKKITQSHIASSIKITLLNIY